MSAVRVAAVAAVSVLALAGAANATVTTFSGVATDTLVQGWGLSGGASLAGNYTFTLTLDRPMAATGVVLNKIIWNEFTNDTHTYVGGEDYPIWDYFTYSPATSFVQTSWVIDPYIVDYGLTHREYDNQHQGGFNIAWDGGAPVSWTFTIDDGRTVEQPGDIGGGQGSAVPEPATWVLMLAGFGMLGSMVRGERARRAT